MKQQFKNAFLNLNMPEGPEVRSVVDHLQVYVGYTIDEITLSSKALNKVTSLPSPSQKITEIWCHGKRIIISCTKMEIYISLGMAGRFIIGKEGDKFKHVQYGFHLSKGSKKVELFYQNPRFPIGDIKFLSSSQLDEELAKLGPDVLTTKFSRDEFEAITRRYPRKQLCTFLMDQGILSGIGNYLKSEILYVSGLLPTRKLATLNEEEIDALRKAISSVPRKSYHSKGCTISDYILPTGEHGCYIPLIYQQKYDPHGNKVVSGTTADGRTSFWVPEVQK